MPVKMQVMSSSLRQGYSVLRTMTRSKITRAEIAKRIQKENKALFGDLIETKKEKTAREKRERKGRISGKKNDLNSISNSLINKEKRELDSEKIWMLGTREKELVKIKFTGRVFPYQTKTILKVSMNSKPSRNPEVSSSRSHSSSRVDSAELSNDKETSEKKEPRNLPTDILVKNITSFSYIDGTKKETNSDERKETISISAYDDKSKLSIPSVTGILKKTMSEASKLNLELWKQRMILEMGVEGFEKYSRELLLNGKQFHSSIQNFLIKKPYDVPEAVEKSWQSVRHVLNDVSDVRVIESHVVHSKLFYRGIVDCVASYKGNLCVIDWKKSDKLKLAIENTFDAPIQVASYIGALNSDINYNFQVRNGLVVVAYTNGDPATIHEVNPALLNKYWRLWLRRLQEYYLDLKKSEQNTSVGDEIAR